MISRRTLWTVGIAAAAIGTGLWIAAAAQPKPSHHRPAPSPDVVVKSSAVKAVADADTKFSFDLLHQLASTPGRNIFVSPYGIANAMSIVLNGASGSTRDGIEKGLGLGSPPIDEVNQGNQLLLPSLESPDPNVQLDIANAVWAGGPINPVFRDTCRTYYDADADTVNLQAAAPTINKWVSDNTEGKIDQIVTDDALSNADLVITNAVYFHGKWTDPFHPEDTESQPFTHEDGSKTPVPLMSEETSVPYLDASNFQAASLPYGNGRMSLYVLLPKPGVKLADVVAGLNESTWNKTTASMKPTDLTLFLPRFKADYSETLNRPLINLGMPQAFGPSADFSKMGIGDSQIGAVLHKATIDVDEEGTTAAAATAIVMRATAVMPPRTIVRVDHPFFVAIRDNLTGTILFEGVIYDPKSK